MSGDRAKPIAGRPPGSAARLAVIGLVALAAVGGGMLALFRPAAPGPPTILPLSLGVNLDGNADWMTAAPWVDAGRTFRAWGRAEKPWETNLGLALTPDGYPLADAACLTYLRGYPDGVYLLTFEGTAEATVSGSGAPDGEARRSGGRTVQRVRVEHDLGEFLTLRLGHIDPADPPRKLRLLVPGADPSSPAVFTPDFLRRVRPFTVLRFMDWTHTNDHPVADWAARTRPDTFCHTSDRGLPWETAVELATVSGKDVWVSIPDRATDDYVRQLARRLRDGLRPATVVRIEYSNEVWNDGFKQAARVEADAAVNPDLTATKPLHRRAQQAAWRLKAIGDIVRAEFGDRAHQIIPVWGGHAANPWWTRWGLEFLAGKYGSVRPAVGELAIGVYAGNVDSPRMTAIDRPGLTADTLFETLTEVVEKDLAGRIRDHRVLAERYGLGLTAYEGGQHLVARNDDAKQPVNLSLKTEANRDRRMGELLRRLVLTWQAEGGGLFMHFSHIGPASEYGAWGLLERADQHGSPKWDAMLSLTLPPGDVTLDGRVDADDFEVVRRNFGMKGAWREDGDLTGDGRVDARDLAALRPLLTTLTPTQEAAVRAFETSISHPDQEPDQ